MINTIVVISDLHYGKIPDKLLNVINESTYCFFLGDGIHSLSDVLLHKGLHIVKGNCDFDNFPEEEIITIDKVKILLTHGHRYQVKRDLLNLYYKAKEEKCDLVLYGHTHLKQEDEIDGIKFINPGSVSEPMDGVPSYCYIVINNDKIVTKLVNME